MPSTIIAPNSPKYFLLQYNWETPLSSSDQKRITENLKKCDTMNFSFNRSGYSLSITIKYNLEERTKFELMKDPQVAAAKSQKVAH